MTIVVEIVANGKTTSQQVIPVAEIAIIKRNAQ
jgi:hypothetical protein